MSRFSVYGNIQQNQPGYGLNCQKTLRQERRSLCNMMVLVRLKTIEEIRCNRLV
jgi:hypothetical protein